MSLTWQIMVQQLRGRLVSDCKLASKWWSTRFMVGGALLSALAFAISLSSAGMQFLGVFGLRGALGLSAIIFVCAFIGRILRQDPIHGPTDDESDQAGA